MPMFFVRTAYMVKYFLLYCGYYRTKSVQAPLGRARMLDLCAPFLQLEQKKGRRQYRHPFFQKRCLG